MKMQPRPEGEERGARGGGGGHTPVGWSRKASLHDFEAELSTVRSDQGKTEEEHFWLRNRHVLRAGMWLQVFEEMKNRGAVMKEDSRGQKTPRSL